MNFAVMLLRLTAPILISSTEKGLQKAAGWPAEGQGAQIDLLVSLLTERIDDPNIPEEEKGRLRRVRDAIGGVGRDVFTEILAAYLARASGLPPS